MKKLILLISLVFFSLASFAQTCTPSGGLTWDRPETFDPAKDYILIFAKKVDTSDRYINIEVPTQDPATYGTPDTNLAVLDGVVPAAIQYENDPLAMLIYMDTGECVSFTGPSTDTTYFFAAFNVDVHLLGAFDYSNAVYASKKLEYSEKVTNILALENRIQWAPIMYYDTAMVIIKQGSAPVTVPVGYAADYLPGVSTDYSASTSYFNGVDATDGKVLYVAEGNRFTLSGLSSFSYTVMIYTITDGCWGRSYEVELDNIPDE